MRHDFDVDLVVGDDVLRAAMHLLLKASGLRVREYRTGREYLDAIPGTTRCPVIDSRLPDMSGLHLCEEVARRDGHSAIVVVADYPEEFEYFRATHPTVRIVHKPFEGQRLVEALNDASRAAQGMGSAAQGPFDADVPAP